MRFLWSNCAAVAPRRALWYNIGEVIRVEDIYKKVGSRPRSKRDALLWICLGLAIVVAAACIWPAAWALRESWKFKSFSSDLTRQTLSAEREGFVAADDGQHHYRLPSGSVGYVFDTLLYYGMGNTKAAAPEGDGVELEFSDGAVLWLCPTQITDEYRENITGIFVRYTDPEGKQYSYDSDRISAQVIMTMVEYKKNYELVG